MDTLRDYRRVWRRPNIGSRWKEWLEARSVLLLVQSDLIVPDGSPGASVKSARHRRLHAESPRNEGPRSWLTCVDTRTDSKWRCSAESRAMECNCGTCWVSISLSTAVMSSMTQFVVPTVFFLAACLARTEVRVNRYSSATRALSTVEQGGAAWSPEWTCKWSIQTRSGSCWDAHQEDTTKPRGAIGE